jgi:hypothetical protein
MWEAFETRLVSVSPNGISPSAAQQVLDSRSKNNYDHSMAGISISKQEQWAFSKAWKQRAEWYVFFAMKKLIQSLGPKSWGTP